MRQMVLAMVGLAGTAISGSAFGQCLHSFSAPATFFAGGTPYDCAVGDFNGDGRSDLAVANFGSHNVSVLIAAGPPSVGSFLLPVQYPVGLTPRDVEVGDFNGDGRPDLAVSVGSEQRMAILLCNPNGTFQPAVTYPVVFGQTYTVRTGRFNADSFTDVAVGVPGGVNFFYGNGNGTFQAAVVHAAGTAPNSFAMGRFNADGVFDLALTEYSNARMRVLAGNGDATFGSPTDYGTQFGPWAIEAGRLNADAHTDLVVTNYVSNSVSVYMGNGDGSFGAPASYLANQWPADVAIADLNLDGHNDLVTANFGARNISVLPGREDGTFGTALHYTTTNNPFGVATGDFNSDGVVDIVAVHHTGAVMVLFNRLCRADFNCDMVVNSQDLFDFLGAFFKLTPRADFSGDGNINSQDFFDFLGAFFDGCP